MWRWWMCLGDVRLQALGRKFPTDEHKPFRASGWISIATITAPTTPPQHRALHHEHTRATAFHARAFGARSVERELEFENSRRARSTFYLRRRIYELEFCQMGLHVKCVIVEHLFFVPCAALR